MPIAGALAAILLSQTTTTVELDPTLKELVDLTNAYRIEQKLGPLKLNAKLVTIAQSHTVDQANRAELTHKGTDGWMVQKRADAIKYNWRRIGEVVASGPTSAADVLKAWVASEQHKKLLVGKFADLGVGLAKSADGTRYWTMVFGQSK
ncbi:MAG: CAP domain-containing protein [Fimbriimonadaceae bacterium]